MKIILATGMWCARFQQNRQKASINFSSQKYSGNPHIPAMFAGMRRTLIFFHSGRPKIQILGAGVANQAVE